MNMPFRCSRLFIFKDPDPSREKYPTLYQYAYKPANEVLDETFSDPLLKGLISVYWGFLGLPPTRLSFAYLAMLFFTYIEFKPFHLRGGSQALSNALTNRFFPRAARFAYNCGVKKILLEGGRIAGVATEQGEQIKTRYVVSNVSPVATYTRLLDPEAVPGNVFHGNAGQDPQPIGLCPFYRVRSRAPGIGYHRIHDLSFRSYGYHG